MSDMIGIIKELDSMGRLVILKDIRDLFKIKKEVELILTKEGVLLRNPKYKPINSSENKTSDIL